MGETIRLKRCWLILLAPLSALLTVLGHRFPEAVERWFSQGLYRVFMETWGRLFGFIPFSVSQFLIIIVPLAVVVYIICELWRIIRYKPRLKRALRMFINLACMASILFFMFVMFCGLNYARMGFGFAAGLEVQPSPVEELVALTEELAKNANESAGKVNRDEENRMVLSAPFGESARVVRTAYRIASAGYPVLGGFTPRPKPIVYSRFMSRLNIIGIYAPFTMEANVNVDVPDYDIPSSMVHEVAHFKGFMREDEANFIAWLVSRAIDEPDFVYSGDMLALSYAMGQLVRVSPADHRRIFNGLHEGIRADWAASHDYWQQFVGPLAEISTQANDAYLRANRQADGVQSYGRMVDLLLAERRART
jgi:hypothetical protein